MDEAVLATATELFEARHFPSVVAVTSDALEQDPEHVALLLLRARAHIALRRDLEAQADLRDIIRIDPACGPAYRLLGQLAARRDEHESAAIFFREALRLDPGDHEAAEWLRIVDQIAPTSRPAAAAQKLPAPAAAAGRFSPPRSAGPRTLSSPARGERPGSQARSLAKGTEPPRDRLGSEPLAESRHDRFESEGPTVPRAPRFAAGSSPELPAPELDEPPTPPLPRRTRPSVPELPGFGEYLVASGILTRERLRAAQAYQRSMKVQLSTAIVTLGLATPQRIEWAAVAHQAQLAGK